MCIVKERTFLASDLNITKLYSFNASIVIQKVKGYSLILKINLRSRSDSKINWFNPFDGVLWGDSNFWVYGRNPMIWPFKWKFSACIFTWCYLFVKILENEIRKCSRNLPLATFGSERVKNEFNMANVRLGNRRIIPIRLVILDIRTSWNNSLNYGLLI